MERTNPKSPTIAYIILGGIILVLFLVRGLLHFDLNEYGHFAGETEHFGIPNFANVTTNLGFLIFGVIGLMHVRQYPEKIRALTLLFSLSLVAISFGSSYFHWKPLPASERLFWDQLPISIGFGSFVGIIMADRVRENLGKTFGYSLSILGAVSVWNIYYGTGSMECYLGLQFGSLVFGILILLAYPRGRLSNPPVALGIALYVIAKVLEAKDAAVFEMTGGLSGHALKHIAATFALASLLYAFPRDKISKP